jgi:ABC-type lipoprotein export system ATPase subunit
MNKWSYNFSFGYDENLFFDNLNLDLSNNKINVVIGKNGVGKSTLFNVLRGNVQSNELIYGTLTINEDIKELEDKNTLNFLYDNVHLVAQDFKSMLASNFTVKDNLEMASIKGLPSFSFFYNEIKYVDLLKDIGIDIAKKAKELSGGQQQLLSIIMSLQHSPSVLLLDEPTSALDDTNSLVLMNLLKKLSIEYNIIILMILHDSELIEAHKSDINMYEIYKNKENKKIIEKR